MGKRWNEGNATVDHDYDARKVRLVSYSQAERNHSALGRSKVVDAICRLSVDGLSVSRNTTIGSGKKWMESFLKEHPEFLTLEKLHLRGKRHASRR